MKNTNKKTFYAKYGKLNCKSVYFRQKFCFQEEVHKTFNVSLYLSIFSTSNFKNTLLCKLPLMVL